MEKQSKTSKDIGANAVSKLLSGNDPMPSDLMNNTGSNCGFKKAIAYANYANSLVTVGLKFNKLKTTGLMFCLMNK